MTGNRLGLGATLVIAFGLMIMAGCASSEQVGTNGRSSDEIAVGYGKQLRSDVTGSVSTLDSKDLTNERPVRLEELIEGRVAGVQVVRLPGGGMTLRIRGAGTFVNSGEPLFVIDGMPITAAPGDALIGLNPNDVQSISVLKDAASTAIYGSRGGNGVIIITTKRR